MKAEAASLAISTRDMADQRAFYDRYFDTWYPFDSGWYVTVSLGREAGAPVVSFFEDKAHGEAARSGATLNILIADVDGLHERMVAAGEEITRPLASNPWGDRGFAVRDPAGMTIYFYREIPPSAEFAPCFRTHPPQ